MDCIVMAPDPAREWSEADANAARGRHLARKRRLQALEESAIPRPSRADVGTGPSKSQVAPPKDGPSKQAVIAAAVERARRRRGQPTSR
jgi:hypothetical protein